MAAFGLAPLPVSAVAKATGSLVTQRVMDCQTIASFLWSQTNRAPLDWHGRGLSRFADNHQHTPHTQMFSIFIALTLASLTFSGFRVSRESQ